MRYLVPDEWDIKVKRKPNGKYYVKYCEFYSKPEDLSEEEFYKGLTDTVKLSPEGLKISINQSEDGRIILGFEGEYSLEEIASTIAFEFLMLTPLGKQTIRDIIISLYIYSQFRKKKDGSIKSVFTIPFKKASS